MVHINIKKRTDFYILYSIIEKNISNENITIFIEEFFLEPLDILILTQFVITQVQRNCTVKIDTNSDKIKKYLNAIDIVAFCKSNYIEPQTISVIDSYTAMPIRRVELSTMNTYIELTQKYFKNFCPNKDLDMLNLCLSELINNVYNHSFSKIGAYVFAQYYPKNNMIKIAVSDLGIGIPMSVNNYKKSTNEKILTNRECVSWALKENMTTKSIPQNKGKGLDNIKSFMKANNCFWKLYTQDVLMNGYSKIYYEANPISFFKGTIVQLNINIANLPQETIIDELEWDNF